MDFVWSLDTSRKLGKVFESTRPKHTFIDMFVSMQGGEGNLPPGGEGGLVETKRSLEIESVLNGDAR